MSRLDGRTDRTFCRHPSPQPRGDGGYSIDTQKGFRERLGIEIVTREDRKRATASSLKGGWSNRELGVHAALIFFLAFFLAVGAFTDQGPFLYDVYKMFYLSYSLEPPLKKRAT